MTATNFLEAAILNANFASSDKVHLHTGDPGEAGTANEVAVGNYAAQTIGGWDAVEAGTGNTQIRKNTNAVTFPTPGVGVPWGTITHFSISNTGGNRLVYEALGSSRVVDSNNPAIFNAGDLKVSVD